MASTKDARCLRKLLQRWFRNRRRAVSAAIVALSRVGSLVVRRQASDAHLPVWG